MTSYKGVSQLAGCCGGGGGDAVASTVTSSVLCGETFYRGEVVVLRRVEQNCSTPSLSSAAPPLQGRHRRWGKKTVCVSPALLCGERLARCESLSDRVCEQQTVV